MADDLTPRDLASLVLDKIRLLGDAKAREYFDVAHGTIIAWKTGKNLPSLAAAQKVWDESLICQTPEIWGQTSEREVKILLPIYREVSPMTHLTLMANYKRYGPEKIGLIPKLRTLIDEARNDLAHKALQTKSEWFVFCDDDMVLPCGNPALLHKNGWAIAQHLGTRYALERIMSHPKEYRIVGGLYRDRRIGNRAQCERAFRSHEENERLLSIMDGKTPDTGLEENGWVATGFVRVHRSVFEEMIEAAKPGGPLADITPPPGRENEPLGFFGRTSRWRGEDVAFGRRAGLIGIKTWTDTGCVIGHKGDRIY